MTAADHPTHRDAAQAGDAIAGCGAGGAATLAAATATPLAAASHRSPSGALAAAATAGSAPATGCDRRPTSVFAAGLLARHDAGSSTTATARSDFLYGGTR
ncbi:hypothetical protein GCM10027569_68670 [Flindersiella endophytica]